MGDLFFISSDSSRRQSAEERKVKGRIGRIVLTDCTVRTAASMGSAHAIAIDGEIVSDVGDGALQKPGDFIR